MESTYFIYGGLGDPTSFDYTKREPGASVPNSSSIFERHQKSTFLCDNYLLKCRCFLIC